MVLYEFNYTKSTWFIIIIIDIIALLIIFSNFLKIGSSFAGSKSSSRNVPNLEKHLHSKLHLQNSTLVHRSQSHGQPIPVSSTACQSLANTQQEVACDSLASGPTQHQGLLPLNSVPQNSGQNQGCASGMVVVESSTSLSQQMQDTSLNERQLHQDNGCMMMTDKNVEKVDNNSTCDNYGSKTGELENISVSMESQPTCLSVSYAAIQQRCMCFHLFIFVFLSKLILLELNCLPQNWVNLFL